MNKIYLILFTFLLFLLFQIPVVKNNVIEFSLLVKNEINYFYNSIEKKFKYFKDQSKKIEELKKENLNLNQQLAYLHTKIEICKDLKEFQFIDLNLTFVKTISYAALPDFTQIYINYNKPVSHLKGLIFNNTAAGVVVKNLGSYSLAYLLTNPKVSFAVIVGKKEIPGIFKGGSFKVEYLKKFEKIKVGDIVKTSGLDGIFYKGVLVGKVIKINQKKLYQEAIIKPFYNKLIPTYFYVVEKK